MKLANSYCCVVLFYTLLSIASGASIVRNDEFQIKAVDEPLDPAGKYLLSWEVDIQASVITFEVKAETLGYVGLGISPSGSMQGADIFLAGVYENGTLYAYDMHAQANGRPTEDAHSDWTLLEAYEDGQITYLKVSRPFNSCDDEDYPISNDTVRVIYAIGASDNIEYHNANRGTKSLNLLMPDPNDFNPDLFSHWDLETEIVMPSGDTTYWCTIHKSPLLMQMHHIVAFEPLFKEELAVNHTHHFAIYKCSTPTGQDADEFFGPFVNHTGSHCYSTGEQQPLPVEYCMGQYIYIWSKGGQRTVFPEDVGHPFPENIGVNNYYLVEIHYDNPLELEDVRFKTGARVSYTNELRPIEAGILAVAHDVNVIMTIPPDQEEFLITAHCGSRCTSDAIPDSGISVFNALLHSHVAGRKLKLRHIRGNVELPWLDYDNHYDFNYQQNKPLRDHVQIMPGDHLTMECTYSTKLTNGNVVVGGLSTSEEMCMAFLWYYPRLPFEYCGSVYPIDRHFEELGITEVLSTTPEGSLEQYLIIKPDELAGDYAESLSTKFNWTESFVRQYEWNRKNTPHAAICPSYDVEHFVQFPEDIIEYVPEDVCKL